MGGGTRLLHSILTQTHVWTGFSSNLTPMFSRCQTLVYCYLSLQNECDTICNNFARLVIFSIWIKRTHCIFWISSSSTLCRLSFFFSGSTFNFLDAGGWLPLECGSSSSSPAVASLTTTWTHTMRPKSPKTLRFLCLHKRPGHCVMWSNLL